MDDDAIGAAAVRLHERYTREIVEAFNVCPWARHARESGELVRRALLQRDGAIEATLALLDELEAAPGVTVAIAIYPLMAIDARAFDEFAARLRRADQDRHGGRPVFVAAAFHPDYALSMRSPAASVPYLRRSPDPSLQLVRYAVIEAARGAQEGKFVFDFTPEAWERLERRAAQPSVSDRIALDNHALLAGEAERLEASYREILADRDRTYRSLGIGAPRG